MRRIAIIGGGMAGITLARTLTAHASVTVFDKSRGLSGRMATRQTDGFMFDHGAQYFTVRDKTFAALVAQAVDAGVVGTWDVDIAGRATGHPRLVGVPAMNAFVRWMADGLDVVLDAEIATVAGTARRWMLQTRDGRGFGPFDCVVTAIPAPQVLRLMPEPFDERAGLARVRIAGCYTVMIGRHDAPALPFIAGPIDGGPIGWMSLNTSKPGRDGSWSLVVNSTNDWADAHIDDDQDTVRATLLEAASAIVGFDLAASDHVGLHRWRYASTTVAAGQDYLLDAESGLAACGDWCIANRVEAAYLSGSRLGDALLAMPGR